MRNDIICDFFFVELDYFGSHQPNVLVYEGFILRKRHCFTLGLFWMKAAEHITEMFQLVFYLP